MAEKIVFLGICLLLVFMPLPLGSVLEWSIFIFVAVTIVLFLIYYFGVRLRQTSRSEAEVRLPLAIKIFLYVYLGVSFLQIVPLPLSIIKIISPLTAEIYSSVSRDELSSLAGHKFFTLTFSPAATSGKLVFVISAGLFAYLVFRVVRTRHRLETLVVLMIACGLFQAFYGMAETFSGHEMIFGWKKGSLGSVSGTFFNRNHLAGFLEMIFPLSLGYVLVKARYFQMEKGMTLREKILWFSQERLQWTILYALASIFIGLGLIFSRSRSGVSIFIFIVFLALYGTASWRDLSSEKELTSLSSDDQTGAHRQKRKNPARIVKLVAGAIVLAAVWFGLGPVIERFSELDISKEGRRIFYRNTIEIIRDYSLVGTGKGTFANVYDMYEKVDDRLKLSFAHNDYLEFLAENGIIAGGCIIISGLSLIGLIFIRWRRTRSNFSKGIGLGIFLGLLAIASHAFTDFNLQIPANIVYFLTLAMLGLNVTTASSDRRPEASNTLKDEDRISQPFRKGVARIHSVCFQRINNSAKKLAAVVLSGIILFCGLKDFLGYHYLGRYRSMRQNARSVQSGFNSLAAVLKKAVRWSGRQDFTVELARLYFDMARAENMNDREEERDRYLDLAIIQYERAIAANPVNAFPYYECGLCYLFINFPLMTYRDRAKPYFRQALELKPADEFLNLNVIFSYLTWWPELGKNEKGYAGRLFQRMIDTDPDFEKKLEGLWQKNFGIIDSRFKDALTELKLQSQPRL